MAVATLAAGCFWGVEQRFAALPGVLGTEVGYTGGATTHPTYEQVCSHTTGHAEAVRVEYDPEQTSYERLLDAFFGMHDPTTPDRQGPDIGSQYRSAVFYHSAEQERAARDHVARLESSDRYGAPIVTEIAPAPEFWRAEEYHQCYLEKRGRGGCLI